MDGHSDNRILNDGAAPQVRTPFVGEDVLFFWANGIGPNGTDHSPAKVTRVFSDDICNLFVMGDLTMPTGHASIAKAGSLYHLHGQSCWTFLYPLEP